MNKSNSTDTQMALYAFAGDILSSSGMMSEKNYKHHGTVTCYDHSVSVAKMSFRIARLLHLKIETKSLIRGALLHDYYLYDWHEPESHTGLHGFNHAKISLTNAERDFALDDIQRDIIAKHMFPMNIAIPRYKETVIVTIADKICATQEICRGLIVRGAPRGEN